MNYGLTEGMRTTLIDFNSESGKRASVGRAAPGNRVRVIGETGVPAAPFEHGIVQIAGPHIAQGYLHREREWRSQRDGEWFVTSDIGYLDDEGYLYYVGRRDDLINYGGKKLSPVKLEEMIAPFFGEANVCVLGIDDPDEVHGQVPVLCLEGRWPDDRPWMDLRTELLGLKSLPAVPTAAYAVTEFPRTANNKIRRAALRELIADGGASPIDR